MKARLIANFVAFEACWFAAVFSAAWGMWYLGSLAILAFTTWHVLTSEAPRKEVMLLGLAAVMGLIIDSTNIALGVFRPDWVVLGVLAPPWLVLMWCSLAATVNGCMAWMDRRWAVLALTGAIGGPIAYVAAGKFGAVTLGDSFVYNVAWLAVTWAIAMPGFFLIKQLVYGREQTPRATSMPATPVPPRKVA